MTKLYTSNEILDEIESAILNKRGFYFCRFGDGTYKVLNTILNNKLDRGYNKYNQQGFTQGDHKEIFRKLVESANYANYISTFKPHYYGILWKKIGLSKGTNNLIKNCETFHEKIGIKNKKFIHPELAFTLLQKNKRNLFSIIDKNHKICFIYNKIGISTLFSIETGHECSEIVIPSINSGNLHWENKDRIMNEINMNIDNGFTIFLLGAGDLGKAYYMPLIKSRGAVAIDAGNVLRVWTDKYYFPPRLKHVLKYKNDFTFELTEYGKRFESVI